jgi:hypothetical protein
MPKRFEHIVTLTNDAQNYNLAELMAPKAIPARSG